MDAQPLARRDRGAASLCSRAVAWCRLGLFWVLLCVGCAAGPAPTIVEDLRSFRREGDRPLTPEAHIALGSGPRVGSPLALRRKCSAYLRAAPDGSGCGRACGTCSTTSATTKMPAF